MAYYEDIVYNNKDIVCLLCRTTIQDENRFIEAHVKSEQHRASEMSRTLVRQSIIVSLHDFYCRLCEMKVESCHINDHIHGKPHESQMEKIKQIIHDDGGYFRFPNHPAECGVELKCFLCDEKVMFTLPAVTLHLSYEKHRRARAIAVQALNGIFSVEGSNDDLWCKFCQVYFENYIEVLFEHVDGNERHRNTMAKILNIIRNQNISIEKYLMDPKEDKARCLKCDRSVSCNIDNLERHVKGKLHSK